MEWELESPSFILKTNGARRRILQNKGAGEAGNQQVPVPDLIENRGIFILVRFPRIHPGCILAEKKKNEYSKSLPNILSARNQSPLLGDSESLYVKLMIRVLKYLLSHQIKFYNI